MQYLCPMRLNGNALIVAVNQAPKRVRQADAPHPEGVWLRDLLRRGQALGKSWDLQVLVYPKTSAVDHTPVAARLVLRHCSTTAASSAANRRSLLRLAAGTFERLGMPLRRPARPYST